jgi:hypothetical protein
MQTDQTEPQIDRRPTGKGQIAGTREAATGFELAIKVVTVCLSGTLEDTYELD